MAVNLMGSLEVILETSRTWRNRLMPSVLLRVLAFSSGTLWYPALSFGFGQLGTKRQRRNAYAIAWEGEVVVCQGGVRRQ